MQGGLFAVPALILIQERHLFRPLGRLAAAVVGLGRLAMARRLILRAAGLASQRERDERLGDDRSGEHYYAPENSLAGWRGGMPTIQDVEREYLART